MGPIMGMEDDLWMVCLPSALRGLGAVGGRPPTAASRELRRPRPLLPRDMPGRGIPSPGVTARSPMLPRRMPPRELPLDKS